VRLTELLASAYGCFGRKTARATTSAGMPTETQNPFWVMEPRRKAIQSELISFHCPEV
jgi:hypothetical protein